VSIGNAFFALAGSKATAPKRKHENEPTQHAENRWNHPRGTAPPFSQLAFKLKNALLQVFL
jgi:parvulin-like peptidyl-prolyl isomerase